MYFCKSEKQKKATKWLQENSHKAQMEQKQKVNKEPEYLEEQKQQRQ